ncbi:MAG TPA: ribonuclease Z [Chitinophagaceae bacterium]|nr:ribonuclease Z [Chitinophagaceae bacterium]
MLGITILGNNSSLPAYDRHPTAQVVTLDDHLFLVDCGEGTQMQLARYRIKWGRINHIFISHLHGDHYFGLPGLLNSMGLLHRETDVHVYGPPMLEEIIRLQLQAAQTLLSYPLYFHCIEEEGVLVETDKFRVSCFATRHRIPCYGFRFDQIKAPRKVDPERAIARGIPAAFYDRLKWGEDYRNKEGILIPNEMVTLPARKPYSYAYSADTIFDERLIEKCWQVDILYHETTYLKEAAERAAARFHSTTVQAAHIALKAGVKQLLIGHFSSKYEKSDMFEQEAKSVFPNTLLALEGVTYKV